MNYMIRRLMPAECCRLQGFLDGWGDIPEKTELTDEEAAFWENVRKTKAEIEGKTYKPFKSRGQLLRWYNSLHTDGAEYTMWGNGMGLPNVLYVLAKIQNSV